MTLAPGTSGEVVTSTTGTVVGVSPKGHGVGVRMDAAWRTVCALTTHGSQGFTIERALLWRTAAAGSWPAAP